MLSVMYRYAGTAGLPNNGSMGAMRWEFNLEDSKETHSIRVGESRHHEFRNVESSA